MKNVVQTIRSKANAWYENAISGGLQRAAAWKQAEGEAKRLGLDGEVSIEIVWSTWEGRYAHYLRKKGKFLKQHLLVARAIDDGTDLPPQPVEPTLVDAPGVLLSASMGKALQITEMFCLWFSLLEVQPTWLDGRVMLISELEKHLVRLTLGATCLYTLDLAEDWLKIKLASLDARSKKQTELPLVKAPFREHSIRSMRAPLPGAAGLELGHWMNAELSRTQAFVFWMKRGAPQVGDAQVKKQEESSLTILTTPQVRCDVMIGGGSLAAPMDITLESLELEVLRTVQETFKGAKWSSEATFQLPSCHAHIDQSRSDGGARSLVASRQPALVTFLDTLTEAMVSLYPTAHAREDGTEPCFWPMSQPLTTRAQFVQEARRENGDYRCVLGRIGLYPGDEEIRCSTRLTHFFDDLCYRVASRDMHKHGVPRGERLPAKIIGLREPLKVRTITAGPEEAYYFASFIQKFVHDHLRKQDTFRLIGGELKLTDIVRTFNRPLKAGEFYVSGDYKSATDLISARLSEACARGIGQVTEMPTDVIELFVDCLVNHELTLGKKTAPQRNGQLMGSPASFPILCLINAALTRYAIEIRQGRVGNLRLGSFPLLINGDDVGFVSDEEGYEIWKLVTRCGGLQFSLGKNFTSRDFLILNSCMFQLGPICTPRPMRPSYPRTCDSVRHGTQRPKDWIRLPPERSPCHGGCPYRGNTPDERRLPEARPRQLFFVPIYQNPDYLGPSGRWVPLDEDPASESARWAQLPAFSRLKIRDINDLFLPEGYAILPGLQKAWLGRTVGPRRHLLNKVFLNSWKPVLELSRFLIKQFGTRGQIRRREKGETGPKRRYTIVHPDWFVPVGLGGLGLENTERFGVFLGPLPQRRNLSPWNAKLAYHLLYRPWLSPMAMPSLDLPSYVEKRIAKRMRSVVPSYCPAEVTPPCGSMTPADLLGVLSREEWMKTFQMELEIETPDVLDSVSLKFHPNLGKRCALERTSLLVKALKGYQQSRQKLYGDLTWLNSPEISEAALAGYLPSAMFYNCSSEKSPIVQLGFERHTLPLVGVMKRTAGYAEFLTPPNVSEAVGPDPGTWTKPVFGALAIAMLRDRPAPFGLRRCS
jgi:hypothetical protein